MGARRSRRCARHEAPRSSEALSRVGGSGLRNASGVAPCPLGRGLGIASFRRHLPPRRRLLAAVCGHDIRMTDQVVIQLGNELDATASLMSHLGYRVISCDSPMSLRHRLSEHPRSAVVIDLDDAAVVPEELREAVSQCFGSYIVGIAQDSGFQPC